MAFEMFVNALVKYNLLLIFLYLNKLENCHGAVVINDFEDGPYKPLPIRLPIHIWKQALRPTPVLKSGATVVIPIHVSDDYNDEDDEEEENDHNEVIQEDEIIEDGLETAQSNPMSSSSNAVSTASTIQGVQEDDVSNTVAPNVVGQAMRFPCSCINGQCGCCTGMMLQRINMKACGNISFVPEDFIFDVKLIMNNRTVVRRRVSASDPPPICFNPRRAPFVEVCLELSNIRIRNNNAFACLDINADIGGFDVYSASFRCFGLGTSGVQTGLKPKPVSSGPTPINLFGTQDEDDDDSDGGIIGNVADGIIGGGDGGGGGGEGIFSGLTNGLFGGGGNSNGGADDEGSPFDAIGDAFDGIGDFLDT